MKNFDSGTYSINVSLNGIASGNPLHTSCLFTKLAPAGVLIYIMPVGRFKVVSSRWKRWYHTIGSQIKQ